MNYDWVESDSQTQSDTTTDSYAAVPAVEQAVSLPRLGRAPRLGSQLCLSDYLLVFVWRPFWPDPDRTGGSTVSPVHRMLQFQHCEAILAREAQDRSMAGQAVE